MYTFQAGRLQPDASSAVAITNEAESELINTRYSLAPQVSISVVKDIEVTIPDYAILTAVPLQRLEFPMLILDFTLCQCSGIWD